jgi:hypothetical protein
MAYTHFRLQEQKVEQQVVFSEPATEKLMDVEEAVQENKS